MLEASNSDSRAKNAINDKRLRSYVLRRGRMTNLQQKGIDEFLPILGCSLEDGLIQPTQLFPQAGSLVLETGFGMGASLLEQAQALPDHNFIGIEVHEPGVGKLLCEAGTLGLKNLRVLEPSLHNTSTINTYVERPASRPLTKFEQRGEHLGHGVWDLIFTKT